MEVDYKKHVKLVSWPAGAQSSHGNPQKEGTLAEMVKLGMEYINKGEVGVKILYDHGTYDAAQIKEIAARSDFPK